MLEDGATEDEICVIAKEKYKILDFYQMTEEETKQRLSLKSGEIFYGYG